MLAKIVITGLDKAEAGEGVPEPERQGLPLHDSRLPVLRGRGGADAEYQNRVALPCPWSVDV